MPPRFKTARFHISSGPTSLFQRVHCKMTERLLKTNADHLQDRAYERDVPLAKLIYFDPKVWVLKTVEVRADTGKFVCSTWEVTIYNKKWRVAIGLNDTIKTVIDVNIRNSGNGESIIRGGELYKFVEKVNSDLMQADSSYEMHYGLK